MMVENLNLNVASLACGDDEMSKHLTRLLRFLDKCVSVYPKKKAVKFNSSTTSGVISTFQPAGHLSSHKGQCVEWPLLRLADFVLRSPRAARTWKSSVAACTFTLDGRGGSSLLAHNVNLAPIKASVGTSVDNRKSSFIEKHPVVGLGVYDPSCCMPAERHVVAVVEPHISSFQFTEQSCHILKINN